MSQQVSELMSLLSQTIKAFLPAMIAKKRGKIVAVASMGAKATFPMATTYCASKYGVDGLMEALFDELCQDDLDESIRLTTVFPYFINTRKELADMMDELDDIAPRMSPRYVAREALKGILQKKRRIYITELTYTPIVP